MYNGYLPIDRTGDGCIQILESLSLMLTLRVLCYGELDGTPVADKAFSISIFCELAAWVCMARYVKGRGRDAVNSMFLPPVFVQAMCRAYFWYMAYPETTIRAPVHIIQVQFPWVLLCPPQHGGACAGHERAVRAGVQSFAPSQAPLPGVLHRLKQRGI